MKVSRIVWPNLITLSNLSLGLVSLLIVSEPGATPDMLFIASFLVTFAAVTDRLDGKVARRLNAVSLLGKELDSLADLVSFGVAPIVAAWRLGLDTLGLAGALVCILYPLAGAFRLARFNSTAFDNVFTGMPITIAGALMSLVNLFNCFLLSRERLTPLHSVWTALIALLMSYLMISRLQIRKR